MILSNNNRSKAYLQNLLKEEILPSNVIYIDKPGVNLSEQTSNDSKIFNKSNQIFERKCSVTGLSFNEKESIPHTLEKNNIPWKNFESLDPNDELIIKQIKRLPEKECVYSGPGGAILKKEIFETKKTFIHAHPGKLPEFKGSTTIYYSLLIEKNISVSVIELNEKIDGGDILRIEDFEFKKGSDLDYVIDPCVRALSLIRYFKNKIEKRKQNKEGDTFYIIHPVLKHLSILKNKAY